MTEVFRVSRRNLLKAGIAGGAGLALGVFDSSADAQRDPPTFAPNAFVHIDYLGNVTIWFTRSEAGQGVKTALPMLVAEELECDWSKVRVQQSSYDPRYGSQDTGGSSNVRDSWEPLRKAGAAAREMLISAAAKQWGVQPDSCRANNGSVIHSASNRRATYGSLTTAAIGQPVPKDVKLKDPSEFKLIGKPLHRVDTPSKVDGSAQFSIDVRVPGMLYATVSRCPVFGGKVARFDDTKAKKVPGVLNVLQIPTGVAVVAKNTWAAIQGRLALDVKWNEGEHAKANSMSLRSQFEEVSRGNGKVLHQKGDLAATPAKTIEAIYEVPFQAHAALEPINCTAHVTKDRCEIWAPTQIPSWAHDAVQKETGLSKEAIRINITLLGGAFGRGITPDFVLEAVQVSKAVGAPVKVQRQREDDLQHDFYRPPSFHRMTGGIDADAWPVLWTDHIVSPSIQAWHNPSTKKPEEGEIGGAFTYPSLLLNSKVEYTYVPSHVPRGWLRSVEHMPNAFAAECFLDELAAAGKKDPLALRLKLLTSVPAIKSPDGEMDSRRLSGVLQLAADKAGWGKPLPAREGRGIAAHFSFRSYVAQVAHVAVDKDGGVKVKKVVCAIDCGQVVNPDTVAAQMEGAIVFGLSQALKGAIVIENGRVAQENFHNYKLLQIDDMPEIEVHIVPSHAAPGGVGEPGVPPIAPALCNALYAATGKRIRALPIRTRLLRQA